LNFVPTEQLEVDHPELQEHVGGLVVVSQDPLKEQSGSPGQSAVQSVSVRGGDAFTDVARSASPSLIANALGEAVSSNIESLLFEK
jgi:hypothetical protein